jgi:maleylacetate reductase
MNAIAHCVEALYAANANPVVSIMAEEGVRALAAALPRIVNEPQDAEARSDALYGAWLAGVTLGSVAIGLHHKLCHTLGGTWNLPHAQTHAVVLPHAARYNRDAAPEAMARIARALGAPDAPTGLYDLGVKLGLGMRLADLGMPDAGLERAAQLASESPYPNPAPLTREGILALLRAAQAGRRPD